MALKVYKVVVVSCPRCVLTAPGGGDSGRGTTVRAEGAGKSCFCNRFVRPDCFSLHHESVLSEEEWRDDPVYNGDHFIYWGAATKKLPHDGTRARFQVVEQTEFYNLDTSEPFSSDDYIARASATRFISRGKVAYKLHSEEEYAIPSSLKHNKSSRATQLFPNHEFSDGKMTPSFIVLYDPTLQGKDIKIQIDFLTKLIKEIVKAKCKLVLACTKCDEATDGKIELGSNLAATVIPKKPIPFIQTSAKEGINVEEVFFHVVSTGKKKNFSKNSIPTYRNVIQSRGQDETYSTNSFTRLVRESVNDFSTEWSDIWPTLQANPTCAKAVDVLGIEHARKLFCQRLMELKVQELRKDSQKRRLSSKDFQAELLEAFSNHPDLGNDSVYDFVYSPRSSSDTPVSRMTHNSFSEVPSTPVATPTIAPSSFPGPELATPPNSVNFGPTSPPPPPPTSSIPSLAMDQTTPTRTIMFSPTRTCQTMDTLVATKFNRSSEFLAALPKLPDDISRHSSLRFRNRTLPPLPTTELFSPTRPLSNDCITKSNPLLDESISTFTSNSTLDRGSSQERGGSLHRRLSTSMDCLQAGTLLEEEENQEMCDNSEASPYLSPIDVKNIMDDRMDKAATCKLPRQRTRPAIPFMDETFIQRSKSFRERSRTLPHFDSFPYRQNGSAIGKAPSPHPTPPPPPPTSLSLRKESPLLLAMTTMSPGGGQSTLDYLPNETAPQILVDTSNEKLDDTSSIASGPFAEIDDNEPDATSVGSLPRHHEQYRSKSHTPDLHSYSSSTLPVRSAMHKFSSSGSFLTPTSLQPYPSSSSRSSPEKENLYASIPADDEYLTMKAGVSLEELLSSQEKPKATVQSRVIEKLKSVTRPKDGGGSDGIDLSNQSSVFYSNTSPRHHQPKKTKSGRSSSDTPTFTKVKRHSEKRPSVQSAIIRPLPPSPTKMMRAASLGSPVKHRKSSGIFRDNNIYESIDENEEWFQQLKREREARNKQKMEQVSSVDPELATKCNAVMEMFLSNPAVQELWLSTIQTVMPDFHPPTETTIPPFTINPEYIISYGSQRGEAAAVFEEEESGNNGGGHRKLTVTDSVLMRMNRSLQQDSSSGSSSSSESESEEESEEEDEVQFDYEENDSEKEVDGEQGLEPPEWPRDDEANQTDTLQSDIGLALAVIHQKYASMDRNQNDLILRISESPKDKEDTSDSEDQEEEETGVSDLTIHTNHTSGYVQTSPDEERVLKLHQDPLPAYVIPHTTGSSYVTQNGHLSVCQLNSLDSGISASNGMAEEITD